MAHDHICRVLLSRSSSLVQYGRGLHVDVSTKKQGSWGPPWRLPVAPPLGQHCPSLPWPGLPPLHLALCFGRNNPTTAPPGLQSRADVAGLESQLVASRGHRDWAVSGPTRANPRAGRAMEMRTQVPKPKGQSHA